MTSKYYAGGHTDYTMSRVASVDGRIANIVATVKGHVPAGGKVLDLGCGDMYLRTALPGYAYTGVDLDTSKAPDAVKHDLAVFPYPFPDASFDAVICSEVLEHLWEPEKSIAEIERILKPGGTLVLTVPNFASVDNQLNRHQLLVYDRRNLFSVEHIRHYTPRTMTTLLEERGLVVKNVLGNSACMSEFFETAHRELDRFLKANGVKAPPAGVDQVLGVMFPTVCPGFLLEAKKNGSRPSQSGAD
jgi:SAM-dependent methyltransferase